MPIPPIRLNGYADKIFLDSKDIAAILGVSRPTAYDIIHGLPHVGGGDGLKLKVRREIFEGYLARREKESVIMEELAKDKFVMVNGRRFYIRQQKGRTMTLQLVNF